jgi:aspartyl-tRNA(Asn)/glutamyl-tRNA(Gln) amidotransferase subunit B
MKYTPVIGLEIHIQLNTKTKLFCACLNEYTPQNPNKNICPFCTGQPGALPSLNKEAVKKAIQFGIAIGGHTPEKTRWDRKNYFYPDLPAGYQISQYDNPIVSGGRLDFFVEDKNNGTFVQSNVALTRAHLEADAGKLLHSGNLTLVDYNRSGCPLIEVVTEPVIRSSAEAMAFVNELQLLVRELGISDGDMDKGQMRFDCNLSLQTEEELKSNTLPNYRTETKNINSVRALGRAIEYEIERQTKLLEEQKRPVQETRGWKDDQNKSVSQRSKEEAMDYRYFPEPDLRVLEISTDDLKKLSKIPKIPSIKRKELLEIGLTHQNANTLIQEKDLYQLFDQTYQNNKQIIKDKNLIKVISNILTVQVLTVAQKNDISSLNVVTPKQLIDLAILFGDKSINNVGLLKIIENTKQNHELDVNTFAKESDLIQSNDENALKEIVNIVIENNPKPVGQYRSGKIEVLGFLVGQCMKLSKGSGNPVIFKQLLEQILSN